MHHLHHLHMHLLHDDFAELEAAVAASNADADGVVVFVGELIANLDPDDRHAVLDRWHPRPAPALTRQGDLPFHVRKPEIELLLAAVYRLLNVADAGRIGALSVHRASVEIHSALLAYEQSGHWRHWRRDQPLPAVGALKSNLHRILVLSKPRSGKDSLGPSAHSIRRSLTDLKSVGQL